MPNTSVRAAAEGMPITNRRSLLALMMGSAVAVAPTLAIAASPVGRLIAAHRAAIAASEEAWNVVSELIDANPTELPRVRVAWMLRGIDADGKDIREPIYRYSVEEIEADCAKTRDLYLGWYTDLKSKPRADATMRTYEARVARLTAELQAQEEENDRIELEAGITAARIEAQSASDLSETHLQDLLSHRPASIEEVSQIAAYLIECENAVTEGFGDRDYDENWPLMVFLANVSKGGDA